MKILVTVGTTQFPELIGELENKQVHAALRGLGCTHLTIQKGGGNIPGSSTDPTNVSPSPDPVISGIQVTSFGYEKSLEGHIENADTVIAHAGAGTALEVLRAGKRLVMVVNDKLQGNHQLELADSLQAAGHVITCYADGLAQALVEVRTKTFTPFPPAQPDKFSSFLDRVCYGIPVNQIVPQGVEGTSTSSSSSSSSGNDSSSG